LHITKGYFSRDHGKPLRAYALTRLRAYARSTNLKDHPLSHFEVFRELWENDTAEYYGFEVSGSVIDSLCEFHNVLWFVGNADCSDDVDRRGYGLEGHGFSGWQRFSDRILLHPEYVPGAFVLSPPFDTDGGFVIGSFGLVHLFMQCSQTDLAVVSNVPLFDPLPTLVDFAVWAHERHNADEAAGRADPFFNVREAGCIFQMAYGWDEPEHSLRYSVEHGLPYGVWLGKVRAAAREWLDQTAFPPKWFPGVEVFEP
jgi:hypothetical protein